MGKFNIPCHQITINYEKLYMFDTSETTLKMNNTCQIKKISTNCHTSWHQSKNHLSDRTKASIYWYYRQL